MNVPLNIVYHIRGRMVSTSARTMFQNTQKHNWSWWRAKTFAMSTSNAVSNWRYIVCVSFCNV